MDYWTGRDQEGGGGGRVETSFAIRYNVFDDCSMMRSMARHIGMLRGGGRTTHLQLGETPYGKKRGTNAATS